MADEAPSDEKRLYKAFQQVADMLLPLEQNLRERGEWLAPRRTEDACLGQVPDLASLAHSAHQEGTSMWECADGTPAQRRVAKELFVGFADRLENAPCRQTHQAELAEGSAL